MADINKLKYDYIRNVLRTKVARFPKHITSTRIASVLESVCGRTELELIGMVGEAKARRAHFTRP